MYLIHIPTDEVMNCFDLSVACTLHKSLRQEQLPALTRLSCSPIPEPTWLIALASNASVSKPAKLIMEYSGFEHQLVIPEKLTVIFTMDVNLSGLQLSLLCSGHCVVEIG